MPTGGFVVAFSFIYQPGIMMQGPWDETLMALLTNVAGVALIAAGFIGYARDTLWHWARLVMLAIGVFVAFSHALDDYLRLALGLSACAVAFLLPRAVGPRRRRDEVSSSRNTAP